jgi:hypothetical protein
MRAGASRTYRRGRVRSRSGPRYPGSRRPRQPPIRPAPPAAETTGLLHQGRPPFTTILQNSCGGWGRPRLVVRQPRAALVQRSSRTVRVAPPGAREAVSCVPWGDVLCRPPDADGVPVILNDDCHCTDEMSRRHRPEICARRLKDMTEIPTSRFKIHKERFKYRPNIVTREQMEKYFVRAVPAVLVA